MLAQVIKGEATALPLNPAVRGYHVVYREKEVNYCPGCSRSHWYVGRVSAECGFCGTALPLIEATSRGAAAWTRPTRTGPLLEAA